MPLYPCFFHLILIWGIKLGSNFPLNSNSQTSKYILHLKFGEILLSLFYMYRFSENMNEEVYVCISHIELILNIEIFFDSKQWFSTFYINILICNNCCQVHNIICSLCILNLQGNKVKLSKSVKENSRDSMKK